MNNELKNENLFEFVEIIEETQTKSIYSYTSTFKEAATSFFKNKTAIFGVVILVILLLGIIIFPFLSNYDPYTVNSSLTNTGPSAQHWWGTDTNGRDFWSRSWGALRYSIILSLIATSINIFFAVLVGLTTGYFLAFDKYFKYIIKVLYAMPTIIILILFSVTFSPSFGVIILSLIVTGWVGPSQQIRAVTLRTKNLDFITASQTLGTKRSKVLKIFFTYALPAILVQFVIIFPRMILAESTLGFLGLSVPDVPTLGNLISDGRNSFLNFPLQLFIPLLILAATTISIQLIGFGLEDSLNTSGDDGI